MLRRREVPLVSLGLMATTVDAQSRRTGRLVVIGGAEDRLHDKVILRRFTELCGGPGSRIRVLSAASSSPERAWDNYQQAFGELGVKASEDRFTMLMGKGEAAARRAWLEEHGDQVEADI